MRALPMSMVLAGVLPAVVGGLAVLWAFSADEPAGAAAAEGRGQPAPSRLAVLWTSGDPDVARQMAFMYAHNAHNGGWFHEVRLVVWGPSARLLAGDKDLQEKIKAMRADGLKVEACVTCANNYGVADALTKLGIEVKPMGKPLSRYYRDGWHVLSL